MNGTDFWTLAVIAGLAGVTVLTRCFFFMSDKPWHLPGWAQRGLQYAPIAALSAVVIPEIVMSQGQLIASWQDARLFAAAASKPLQAGRPHQPSPRCSGRYTAMPSTMVSSTFLLRK